MVLFTAVVFLIPVHSQGEEEIFSEVTISSYPHGWGYAYKTLYPNLRVFGGHMSGPQEAPLVHQSEEWLPPGLGTEALTLVQEIILRHKNQPPNPPLPDRTRQGFLLVEICLPENRMLRFIAPWEGPFSDPAVQALWNLIAASPAGAW